MGFVITIGREYGSGGRYIAQELAKKLKIKFYDEELIKKVAEKDGKTLNDEEMRKWTKKQASEFIEKCKGGNK